MGKKDIITNTFLRDNDRFADVCNYALFEGEERIKAEELREVLPVEQIMSVSGKNRGWKKERDILKEAIIRQTEEYTIIVLGVENQTDVHYAMPVRNMFYDCLNYSGQIKEVAEQNRKNSCGMSGAEFLSGLRKEDRLTPVITLTVYWGTEDWDGPRNLHAMMRTQDERVLSLVEDYHLKLVEPLRMNESDFDKFRTDVKQVFKALSVAPFREGMEKLFHTDESFRTLNLEAAETIAVLLNINLNINEEEEVADMCKAWEDNTRISEERGEKRGEKRFARLVQSLMRDNRLEELREVTVNPKLKKKLYREYGIA